MIRLTEDEARELLNSVISPQGAQILLNNEIKSTTQNWKKEGWIIEEKKICPMCREKELEKYQTVCSACEFDERS